MDIARDRRSRENVERDGPKPLTDNQGRRHDWPGHGEAHAAPAARRAGGGAGRVARWLPVWCAAGLALAGGAPGGCSVIHPVPLDIAAPAALSPPQAEAERQISMALEAARALEPGNPLLVSALHNAAAFYHEQRRYAHAEALYRELLRIQETRTGGRHPDMALILEKYAAVLRDAERLDDAQRLDARAKRIRAEYEPRAAPAP